MKPKSLKFNDGSRICVLSGFPMQLVLPQIEPDLWPAEEQARALYRANPDGVGIAALDFRARFHAIGVFFCGDPDPEQNGWNWVVALDGGQALARLNVGYEALEGGRAGLEEFFERAGVT